ncbi:hypothetical protein BJ912DRAFT_982790 [Pholiota molesta]|nr:hypothetical protein BJ912DRAFT_982790 [Pholiota molesta]
MDRWQSGAVVDEMNSISGLSTLRMEWTGDSEGLDKLPRLALTLHTLNATLILSFDFPSLKWLRLQRFGSKDKTETIMGFFRRHPQLHSLSLVGCTGTWFSNDIEAGFLPNLKHLKFLVSLAFVDSYNAQVPYLLRAEIADPQDRKLEGKNRKKAGSIDFSNGYMHSIVRGAPNLEELGLHGIYLNSESMQSLHPALSQLVKMQSVYAPRGCNKHQRKYLPYIYAKIERDSVGDVTGVRQGKGVGMLISADEDDPFPCNP